MKINSRIFKVLSLLIVFVFFLFLVILAGRSALGSTINSSMEHETAMDLHESLAHFSSGPVAHPAKVDSDHLLTGQGNS